MDLKGGAKNGDWLRAQEAGEAHAQESARLAGASAGHKAACAGRWGRMDAEKRRAKMNPVGNLGVAVG